MKDEEGRVLKKFLILLGILALTCLTLSPCLQNGFVNWDDPNYLTDNLTVQNLTWCNLKEMFSPSTIVSQGHLYQPLTLLSLAVDCYYFGLNPFYFHLTNLLLHLINVILVFWFVSLISSFAWRGERKGEYRVAVLTAVLFAVHPLIVEPVAWVSSRKDVLYVFFYLLALISYIGYCQKINGQRVYFALSVLLFLLALLSKPVAVTFPLVLLCIDYLHQKSFNRSLILNKIPFFLLAGIFSLVYLGQRSAQPVPFVPYSIFERILIVSYAIFFYLKNIFFPFPLSALYPYPEKINGFLPYHFYIAPFILFFLIFLVCKFFKSHREIIFGIFFFFLTIWLVAGFSPTGDYLLADRYMYLPSLGIFYVLATAYQLISSSRYGAVKWSAKISLWAGLIIFSFMSFHRCQVWANSETLWRDVLRQYPKETRALDNLAAISLEAKDRQGAQMYIQKSLALRPKNDAAFNNLGLIHMQEQKWEQAAENFREAISINPNYSVAYNNLGLVLMQKGYFAEAKETFTNAMKINSELLEARLNLAELYQRTGNTDKAQEIYERINRRYPFELNSRYYLAAMYCEQGKFPQALRMAKEIFKRETDARRLNETGSLFARNNLPKAALKFYKKAFKINPWETTTYLEMGKLYGNLNNLEAAISVWEQGFKIAPTEKQFPELIATARELMKTDEK